MSEDRDKQVKHHLREALKLMENIEPLPDVTLPKVKEKKKAKITPKNSTSFKVLTMDEEDFDILGVDIIKIFPEKSGTSHDKAWSKQSIIIKDTHDEERELIAWSDTIDTFRPVRVGDRINITCLKNVKQYERRDGTVITQYTVGGNTEIEIVKGDA